MIFHNLVSFVTPVDPTLLQEFRQRVENLEAPGIHELPDIQDSGLQRVVYTSQVKTKIPVHLKQSFPIRVVPGIACGID